MGDRPLAAGAGGVCALAAAGLAVGFPGAVLDRSRAVCGLALAASVVLPVLARAGFGPGGENSADAIRALTVAYAIGPCVAKLGALALVFRLPQEGGS